MLSSAGVSAAYISAATGEGVSGLMAETMRMLDKVAVEREAVKPPKKVFRPQPRVSGIGVHKEEGIFVIVAPGLERLVTRGGGTGDELHWQLRRQLVRMGAGKALKKAGVKPGDRVRCGTREWEW